MGLVADVAEHEVCEVAIFVGKDVEETVWFGGRVSLIVALKGHSSVFMEGMGKSKISTYVHHQ